MRSGALLLLVAALLTGCRTGLAYDPATVPRYHGGPVQDTVSVRDTLRIVTFNIRYAQQVDRALEVLRAAPLADADVLLLQEMDEQGTWRIAEALGMHYVYYPAVRHVRTRRDFGNAILSRLPLIDHERILLPHAGRFTGTRRTATAATLRLGAHTLRVYSVHLATIVEAGPGVRARQLCAVVEDAQRYPAAVIGGDLNSSIVAEAAVALGLEWPTSNGPPTSIAGRLDHVLLHNVEAVPGRRGVVRDVRGASDHKPVWIDITVERSEP